MFSPPSLQKSASGNGLKKPMVVTSVFRQKVLVGLLNTALHYSFFPGVSCSKFSCDVFPSALLWTWFQWDFLKEFNAYRQGSGKKSWGGVGLSCLFQNCSEKKLQKALKMLWETAVGNQGLLPLYFSRISLLLCHCFQSKNELKTGRKNINSECPSQAKFYWK